GRLALWQGTKVLPRRLDGRVDHRWAAGVMRAARRADMTDPLLWVNDPTGAAVLSVTGWRALYDITDDWLEADRTPAEHDRLVRDEEYLMTHCAEVVVCSTGLVTTKSPIRPVTLIQNAVDTAAYAQRHARPIDLPAGRVALYAGTVHTDRMDLDLLANTARRTGPDVTVTIVGPVPLPDSAVATLRAAGVMMLGAKPAEQVPAYLQHADVLLVPHLTNTFTDSLDPIKLYEYQAADRNVVATPVAGFRDVTDPRVAVVPAAQFAAEVTDAATRPVPTGHGIVAPSWESRVERYSAVLDRLSAAVRAG
ncbi:glycosyltransferase, partial [Kribbia dieselivorans]|uniref:glycosyltransferase n=1 Tax=Kribbia dieselivorans TaxID=331526 RepID=UPI00083930AD